MAVLEGSPAARTGRWPWRRVLVVTAATLLVAVAGILRAAWTMSPVATDVGARVRSRLALHEGHIVQLTAIAPTLRQAVVATEDERFYRHHGIDVIGIARAAAYDVGHMSLREGASTITEQLAKDLYLGGDDDSVWRKLEDASVALRIESHVSKERILDAYLNTAYFGHGAYGVGEAARRYFRVRPDALTLAQSTMLAGLVQSPSTDDPFVDPAAARERQEDVLRSMLRNHDLTVAEARRALDRPLRLVGGRELPPVPNADLSTGDAFSGWEMASGIAILLVGAAVLAARRRGLWRLAPASAALAGLLLVARAFRRD